MKLNTFFIFFCFFTISVISQNEIVSSKQVDSIIKSLDTVPSDFKKVTLLTGLSGRYRYIKNTEALLDEALKISEANQNNAMFARTYYSKGNYFYYNTQLDSSLYYLNKAKEAINKTEPDYLLKSSILNTIGGVYKKKGNVPKAISTLLLSKTILEKTDTLQLSEKEKYKFKGQSLVLNNSLANFYNQMEDFETALPYYDEAYLNALKLNSKTNAGAILTNKGDLLLKKGDYQEALTILKRAKKLKIEGKAPIRSIANTDLTIGIANFKNGLLNKSLSSFNQALKSFEEIENTSGIANVLFERGKLYNKTKEFEKAKTDCEKAKKLSYKLNDLEYQISSCQCLFEAYKGLGNYKKSLENYELYLESKDSIFNEKNIKKLTQLQMQYEFDKKQEQQKLIAQKKEQQRKLYQIFAIAILVIALLLVFFMLKNRNKNKQISKALEEKEVLLKEIHHRVKNNLQVVSSLLSLQQRQTKDSTANQALQEGRNRVKAMALIHQNLYQDENLVGVDTQQYITKLVNNLVSTYKTDSKSIQINTNIQPIKLDVDTIIPLGLIINELISNSLKYAFLNRDSGEISINLNIVNSFLNLTVKDNGEGLPKGFSIENSESLGYKLIRSFSQKLAANFNIESSENGTAINLKIKKFKAV